MPGRTGEAAAALIADEGVELQPSRARGSCARRRSSRSAAAARRCSTSPGPPVDERRLGAPTSARSRSALSAHGVLVCSGSVPPGSPPDAYGRLAALAARGRRGERRRRRRGDAAARARRRADLVTPNLGEAEARARARAAAASRCERRGRAAARAGGGRGAGARRARGPRSSPPTPRAPRWPRAARPRSGSPAPARGRGPQPDRRRRRARLRARRRARARRAARRRRARRASRRPPRASSTRPPASSTPRARRSSPTRSLDIRPSGALASAAPVTTLSRPTMRDVARAGGREPQDRLAGDQRRGRGHPRHRRARSPSAIDALGFERNDLARSLRQGRTSSTLGLVIEDVANPFYSAIAQAVEEVARDRGLLLITASALEDPDARARAGRRAAAPPRRRAADRARRPRPPLHLGSGRPRTWSSSTARRRAIEADTVLLDNLGGARRAVEHLIAHGHTRIAFVADAAELYTARERLAGYREALSARGARARTRRWSSAATTTPTPRRRAVAQLLGLPDERRPTALLRRQQPQHGRRAARARRPRAPARAGRLRRLRAGRPARHRPSCAPTRRARRAGGGARVRPPRRRRPPAAARSPSRPS